MIFVQSRARLFLTIFVSMMIYGCSLERNGGVTSTGNTGKISGRILLLDSNGQAARKSDSNSAPLKLTVLLFQQGVLRPIDSAFILNGQTYLFDSLGAGNYKVFGVSDTIGWFSDTVRVSLKEGAVAVQDVPVVQPSRKGPGYLPVRKGLTWLKRKRETKFPVDFLACGGGINGALSMCNAYVGDQPCNGVLPMLCNKSEWLARPAYQVDYPSRTNDPYYGPWQGGHSALGPRVAGTWLRSKVVADSFCAADLGVGWKMAGFHDGLYMVGMDSLTYHDETWNASLASTGAWGFYTYTSNIPMDIRFWVYIDDQSANCWNP